MRNVSYVMCEKQRCRSACASASGMSLGSVTKISSLTLASVAEQASLSLTSSETPKDTFSYDEAQLVTSWDVYKMYGPLACQLPIAFYWLLTSPVWLLLTVNHVSIMTRSWAIKTRTFSNTNSHHLVYIIYVHICKQYLKLIIDVIKSNCLHGT